MAQLAFEIDWLALPDTNMDRAEACTFADIRLRLNGKPVTELEDLVARTLRDGMYVSAYPLASFFAANWWRLRWEPPVAHQSPHWRKAHAISAAGYGYAWPNLTIASDTEGLHVRAESTAESPTAPVRYIAECDAWIAAADFEYAVDRFIETVISRLREFGISDTELEELWAEVTAERQDSDLQQRRFIEALAGWDPDDAPDAFLDGLQQAQGEFGKSSIYEITASSRQNALNHLQALKNAQTHSIGFDLASLQPIRTRIRDIARKTNVPPWQRAAEAAQLVRKSWGVNANPITNTRLGETVQTEPHALDNASEYGSDFGSPYSASFAIDGNAGQFVLNRRPSTSRRFALCRLLADRLQNHDDDALSAATEAPTVRQKFQHAFAQELLCPIDALIQNLGDGDCGEKEMEEAADHFQVSPLVVHTALVNNAYLSVESLNEFR